jgi:uncharacterized protein (DUF58 family)
MGELMVRREEQPWESQATVLLDTRRVGHRGEGPTASFEWAVSAAASIAIHLRHNGYKIRLVTGGGTDIDSTERDGDGVLLDALAEAQLDIRGALAPVIERVRRRGDGGLIIAVLGGLALVEAESLLALRASGTTCIALLIEPSTWLNLSEPERKQAEANHTAAMLTLLRGGWRVVTVTHGAKLSAVWPAAASRGSQGFAVRAAMAETVAPGQTGP